MRTIKLESKNLSVNQIQQLKNQIEKLKEACNKGCENLVQYATERLYELFVQNCKRYNIDNSESRIHYDYDKETKIGKVWTDDIVIIFNEFGTGIKGTQDKWASKYGYHVNASGKGENGWWYPTDESDPNPHKWKDADGQLRALTHGLDSRHMLYDAYMQLQSEFSEIIEMTIGKAIGDLY